MNVSTRTIGVLVVLGAACGGETQARREAQANVQANARSTSIASPSTAANDQGRCEANAIDREASEYDTSGDDVPDVRKVFRRIGTPPAARLVLICREVDLNADGVKDVVRYYTEEGAPIREEEDRNFDGRMDAVKFFEEGHISRIEMDRDGNGSIDAKIFYERGKPVRSEIDSAGRSTADRWQPDRWEYFDNGRVVRMGMDMDGDGRVDRWDRDEEFRREQERRREEQERETAARQAAAAAQGDAGAAGDAG